MLNELNAYKNLDVYVTGSNSKMLSKDMGVSEFLCIFFMNPIN